MQPITTPDSTAPRQGPRLTVEASCSGCAHESSDSYTAQADSGFRVFCMHAAAPRRVDGRSYIGDTTWTAPAWCPLLAEATERLAASLVPPATRATEPPQRSEGGGGPYADVHAGHDLDKGPEIRE